jgi:hypothetical protein
MIGGASRGRSAHHIVHAAVLVDEGGVEDIGGGEGKPEVPRGAGHGAGWGCFGCGHDCVGRL